MPDESPASSSPRVSIYTTLISSLALVLAATVPVWFNRTNKIDEAQNKISQLEASLKSANGRASVLEKQNNDLQHEFARQIARLAKQPANKQDQLDVLFHSPKTGSRVERSL